MNMHPAPFLALAALAATTACVTTPPAPVEPPEYQTYGSPVAFGEWVWLSEPNLAISPRELVGDSRCPPNVRCFWAGEVRLMVLVANNPEPYVIYHDHGPATLVETEMGSEDGLWLFGGQIDVERVDPSPAMTNETIAPEDYRFTFRFTPGERQAPN